MNINKNSIILYIILSLLSLFFLSHSYAWTLKNGAIFKSPMGICIYIPHAPHSILIAALTSGSSYTCVGVACNATTIYANPSKGNMRNAFCPLTYYEEGKGCIQDNVTSTTNIIVAGGGYSTYGETQSLQCGAY